MLNTTVTYLEKKNSINLLLLKKAYVLLNLSQWLLFFV